MIYIKRFLFYATINDQFKTTETEKCREVGGANNSSLKVLLEWTGNVQFLYNP